MKIQSLCVGELATNCYLLQNGSNDQMIIVDPADEADRIKAGVEAMDGSPAAVYLTHGHFDHIGAAKELSEYFKIPVVACESEKELLEEPRLNLSKGLGWDIMEPVSLKADVFVKEGDVLEYAGMKCTVLHTPGHTSGCCCFYFEEDKVLICGDTLFAGSCGRTDFPTSSPADMQKSLNRLVNTLPEDVSVYPGHGMVSTIGYEKRFNAFV